MKKHGKGFTPKNQESKDPALAGTMYRNQGTGYARGGSVGSLKGGSGSGLGRLRKTRAAAKVPDKTEN